jgi:hypothetical protein
MPIHMVDAPPGYRKGDVIIALTARQLQDTVNAMRFSFGSASKGTPGNTAYHRLKDAEARFHGDNVPPTPTRR